MRRKPRIVAAVLRCVCRVSAALHAPRRMRAHLIAQWAKADTWCRASEPVTNGR